ncbi:MAG: D-alanyl-D-alanine carboxypeptidase [Oscillospiraceae bacterium]|nr:D-alanyl-D-alanine carboxypeptidase [Oscillospiraceae bacterium]
MRRRKIARFMAGIMSLLMAGLLLPMTVWADGPPEISATAAAVMELSTGRLLYGKNEDAALPMASTTKIMTALLTLEAGDLDRVFTVSSSAIQVEGTSMGLQKGDQVTLRTLACGMLLSSGNDAAGAAAVRIAGSLSEFAELMNRRAVQLGMTGSSFVTPSGLDAEGHYSTAADMARLACAALQNEDFRAICSQSSMKVSFGNPPSDRWLQNHNKLLESYEGCIGVKTGFTKLAGRCLVSAAERDGVTLVCVTLKDPNDWEDHRALLDWGFDQLERVELEAELSDVTLPVTGGYLQQVPVYQEKKLSLVLPTGEGKALRQVLYLPRFAYAPVRAGETVGEVRWYLGEGESRRLCASAPLLAGSTSEADLTLRPTLIWRIRGWLHRLFAG